MIVGERLIDYIRAGNDFSVAGTTSNRILIFDIDDTILQSNAKIYVMKNDKVVRTLSSTEFNDYKLKADETFDFTEFSSYEGLLNSVILPYFHTMKREYSKGTHICVLTARSDAEMCKNILLSHGIRIKDDLMIAIHDPKMNYTGTIAERKRRAIEELIQLGYRTLVFFDDNKENLKEAKRVCRDFEGVKIITVQA